MLHNITIDGTDYSEVVILESITLEEQLEGRTSAATFSLPVELDDEDLPEPFQEVIITDADTDDKQFRGYITQVSQSNLHKELQLWDIACISYGDYVLKRRIVTDSWEGESDQDIIVDTFADLLPEVDTSNVEEIATSLTLEAKDMTLEELLNRVSDLSGGVWWVTPENELFYTTPGSIAAPFGFSDNPSFPDEA